MASSVGILGKQLTEIWRHFGINQKVSVIMGLLLTVGLLSGLVYWNSRPSFRLLATMSLTDAAATRELMQDNKIPVELRDSGRAIYVPAADVYRARLMMAAKGLPKETSAGQSSAGFEMFEQPKFGLTDFAQQINYQRAIQGELERTICSMEGIQSCKVLISPVKERLFSSGKEKKASASIMLTVKMDVSSAQIKSIKQLVAGAVPGLSPSAIAISDQYGHVLARGGAGEEDNGIALSSDHLEIQEHIEAMLTKKSQEMLDLALGESNSIVRVSAIMDFSSIEKRKETIDPESRVATTETISTESTDSGSSGGGGTVAMKVGTAREEGGGKSKKEDITTQYQVPTGLELTVDRAARIKRLSVSVCVRKGTTPITAEQRKQIEEMISRAVGLVKNPPEREDAISVAEMDFPAAKAGEAPKKEPWYRALPVPFSSLGNGALAVIVIVGVFIMSRRIMAGLAVQSQEVGQPVGTLSGGLGGGGMGGGRPGTMQEPSMDDVMRLAEHNPKAIAAWITNVTRSRK